MRKPIKELDGLYEIDEHGNVYTMPRKLKTPTSEYFTKERKLKPYNNGYGYLLVDLRKEGKRYMRLVHRLVAETFLPNPNNLPQVNHIDGNKSNNDITNLEWCSCSENQYHAFRNNLKPKNFKHPNSKLTLEQVLYIKHHCKEYSMYYFAKKYKVNTATIKQIIEGKSYREIN